MVKPDTPVYQFGPFLLDTAERRLLRDGRPVALTAKLFDILLLLVRNSGKVVTKETLMREVWSDSFVEENNLTVSISSLRKMLGERYREREYIETVTKLGYRFTARVEQVDYENAERPGAGEPISSLAVLPFLNMSESPDLEYLSDGITENIIASVSRLPRLRVMARSTVFRYKERELDARQVGRELHVRAVLWGSLREFNGRLLLGVEMVDVSDGSQIWGATYNRPLSDIFRVQEEIAGELSEKLRIELTSEERERLAGRHAQSFEVYYLYLKGRHFWNKRTVKGVKRAVKYFEESLRREPNYARARVGLADCYLAFVFLNMLSISEGISAVRREATAALALDETIAEAHSALGYIEMMDLNWPEAERKFRRALELNPNNATARNRYSTYLSVMGRIEEAVLHMEHALTNDPLSPHLRVNAARMYYYTGQYERAIEQCRQALEIEPRFAAAYGVLGFIYEKRGMYEEAISVIHRALGLLGNDPEAYGVLGYLYAVSGRRREARGMLNKVLKPPREKCTSPIYIAWIYAGLREREKAFEWLEKAYEERSHVFYLTILPFFDYLRPDPRYAELLRRSGLPPQRPPIT